MLISVMEKVRKHHTLRPESQLSDVSSLDSTIMESQQGSESNKTCGSCSQSHEDLLSWPLHFPDTMSTCESNRFDLVCFQQNKYHLLAVSLTIVLGSKSYREQSSQSVLIIKELLLRVCNPIFSKRQ